MGTEITIRQATADDLDTIAYLKSVGFGSDQAVTRVNLADNPRYNISHIVIAEVDGQAVGTATAFPSQMWISGVPLQLGAVASVTTLPEFRNRGVATALMQHLLEKMARDGVAISALFPAAYTLYQSLGYGLAAVWHAYSLKPSNLPQFSETANVRDFVMDDLPSLRSIYRGSQLSLADGRVTRSNTWWEWLVSQTLREGNRHIVVYEGGDGVEGYLKYQIAEDHALKVVEMIVAGEAAYRGLWGYMASQPDIERIDYLAPADDPILHLMQIPGDSHGGNRGWIYDDIYHATLSFMLRVVDVGEALTSRFYPHDMMGHRVFKIHDAQLPANETLINFRIVDGRPDILPDEGKEPDIETDIVTFSQVFCGFMSPESARRLGRLKADDETILWLERAMAANPLFIQQGDRF